MAHAVPMLMYHAISAEMAPDQARYTTTPASFARHMRALRDQGWQTLTLRELLSLWDAGQPPPNPTAVVSFDDGFACLHQIALPILQDHGIRASAFLIAHQIGAASQLSTRLAICPRPMLSGAQVRELVAAGIEIGSHTLSHPDLRTLSAAALRNELWRSRAVLEDLTGHAVETLAYPRGWFNRAVYTATIAAGYRAACTTLPGLNTGASDRFMLRRIQIGERTSQWALQALLRWGTLPPQDARQVLRQRAIEGLARWRHHDPLDLYGLPLRDIIRHRPGSTLPQMPS